MPKHIEITSVPKGFAPLWIREVSVGLIIATEPDDLTLRLAEFTLDLHPGVVVKTQTLIRALEVKNPIAARWWKNHERMHPNSMLIFLPECFKYVS